MPQNFLDGYNGVDIAVLTDEIDEVWAKGVTTVPVLESYFDYYYTGQDCRVYIEGAETYLNLVQMAWSIEQKKMPVYGHASHTYDAVMRGNRLVTGAFSIIVRQVGDMTQFIAQAADARDKTRKNSRNLAPISQDLEDIQRYWTVNTDNALSPSGSHHIFSSHPPFNMIVDIGLQMDSLGYQQGVAFDMNENPINQYATSDIIGGNYNERFTNVSLEGSNKRLLQNVELVKLEQQVSVDGDVLLETYSFFARDEYPINT